MREKNQDGCIMIMVLLLFWIDIQENEGILTGSAGTSPGRMVGLVPMGRLGSSRGV